jgi:hypothetical protein
VGRTGGLAVGVALFVAAGPPDRLSAQTLSQFSYDSLKLSGIQADVGTLSARDFRGTSVVAARVDAGYIAPRVRVLLGISFARSQLNARAIARFNRQLKALVNDPDSNATIDVGKIALSDFTGDLDLQYVFPQGRSVWTYLGLGVGIHARNSSGRAINGTFVEEALDGVSPALNATIGVDVALAPHWRLTTELRGAVLSNFSTASIQLGFAYRIGARQ